MALTIDIPEDLERKLRAETPDLDAAAREAFLVDLYRQGRLLHKELSDLLGLDRWETDAVLRKHKVVEDLPTIDEIREQVRTSRRIRSRR